MAALDEIHADLRAGLGRRRPATPGQVRGDRAPLGARAASSPWASSGSCTCSFTGPGSAPSPCAWPCSCCVGVAVAGLVRDSLDARAGAPDWTDPAAAADGARRRRPRLAAYVRLVEGHLSAADPTRRCATAWPRSATSGWSAATGSTGRTRRRGTRCASCSASGCWTTSRPPRRLRRDEIDDHLRRIEEL